MRLDVNTWGPMTVLMVGIALILVAVGGVVVIIDSDTLSFQEYIDVLWKLALAVAGLGAARAGLKGAERIAQAKEYVKDLDDDPGDEEPALEGPAYAEEPTTTRKSHRGLKD